MTMGPVTVDSAARGNSMSATDGDRPLIPRIVVISGPSGTGKTTIVRHLVSEAPVPLMKVITATTRAPRAGEISGIDYHFMSVADFLEQRAAGAFLETAEVFASGTWYGTPRSEVERISAAGAWVLLEIDVRGALEIKRQYPGAVMIFLRTSSLDEYEARLRGRGTETDEAIGDRLRRMEQELRSADLYDHQVINDNVQRAVAEIGDILQRHEATQNA